MKAEEPRSGWPVPEHLVSTKSRDFDCGFPATLSRLSASDDFWAPTAAKLPSRPHATSKECNHMIQFTLGLFTPIMFFFAVMVYLADFRLVSIAFAAAGVLSYFLSEELKSR
jgi:hypothetical protein